MIESMATRLVQIARDHRMPWLEREAARESLRNIARSDSSAVERSRAEAALAELGLPSTDDLTKTTEPAAPSERDEAADRAEEFLRSVPLDAVARRCLEFSGKPTFLQARHDVICQFGETEDPRPSDEAIRRLHDLTTAASAVNVYSVEPGAQPDMHRLFVLLGLLDPTKDRAMALEAAQADYMKLATTKDRACV